jgi:hypothetical protein
LGTGNARRELYQDVRNFVWSVISPLLAHIYLHELDHYMAEMRRTFHHGRRRAPNPRDQRQAEHLCRLSRNIDRLRAEGHPEASTIREITPQINVLDKARKGGDEWQSV